MMRADPHHTPATSEKESPKATIELREAIALIIGIVIGAGIFRVPAAVAGNASSAAELLLAWLAGGLLSICGALCYAELASTYPTTGGDYAFLKLAYGRRLAFLFS